MTTLWESRLSEMHRFAFDSNALIYLLEEKEPYATYIQGALATIEAGQAMGFISVVVEMEILVKPLRERNAGYLDRLELFFRRRPNLHLLEVSRPIAHRAADLRARLHLAPLDSLIASTALEFKCDAIVGNDAIFASKATGVPYLYLNDYTRG